MIFLNVSKIYLDLIARGRMKKFTVTLMCGLPGSGKTTWIKNNKKSDTDIISLDDIRHSIFGHQFYRDAEPWILAFAASMAKILLEQKRSIIIDATNLLPFMRNTWRTMAQKYGAKIELVLLDVPLAVCIKRNNTRSKSKRVPITVLKQFNDIFVPPSHKYEPYDKIIIIEE
jgi:predicted kinase